MPKLAFCPSCGAGQLAESSARRLACDRCGLVLYLNVAATASLIMRCDNQVLMTERAGEPAKGKFDFPGGFVEAGESLEAGLEREILEELNFRPRDYRYFMSAPNRYPYRELDYELCDAYFLLELEQRPELQAGDDVTAFVWKNPHRIQRSEVAFDSVWQVVERLRATTSKSERQDIE